MQSFESEQEPTTLRRMKQYQASKTPGWLAQPGPLVDARVVDVPRKRNPREENATIQAGGTPAE